MPRRPVLSSAPSAEGNVAAQMPSPTATMERRLDLGATTVMADQDGSIVPAGWPAVVDHVTQDSPSSSRSPSGRDARNLSYSGASAAASAGLDAEGNSIDDQDGQSDERTSLLGSNGKGPGKKLPWYRQPSPWYIIGTLFCFALSMGLLAAPKIELFTQAICQQINSDTEASHSPLELPTLLLKTPAECRHSPAVQRRLSELNLSISLTMGILCTLTTTFWGALSDRIGRRTPIALNMLSFVLGDLVLITVLSHPGKISYWWAVMFAACEGVFGGMTGGQSIMSAYISDCTEAGSRAGIFSMMMGIVFGGIAAGPAISSLLIEFTHNTVAPFYLTLGLHICVFVFTALLMPESLPAGKQQEARKIYVARKAEKRDATQKAIHEARRNGRGAFRVLAIRLNILFAPITTVFVPLKLLAPRKRSNGALDWSLPALALSTALYSMPLSVINVKMQYAQLKFGWNAVQLGNLMSLIGLTRIAALMVVIPLIVRVVRKPHQEPERESPAVDPSSAEASASAFTITSNPGTSAFSKAEDDEWDKHKAEHRLIHDYKFDLLLARASITLDFCVWSGLVFTSSSTYFVILTVANGLGSGANPALSSLALMFADPKETGALMAAMGVAGILCGQIIAPIVFNGIFAASVDTFPEAFFVGGATVFFLSAVSLLFVKVRRPKWNGYTGPSTEEETANASQITQA